MEDKLTIQVHGQVSGFRYEDETADHAAARLVLAAEMEVNNLNYLRIHLNAADPSLTEIFGDGIIRNDCAWDSILSRGERSSAIADKSDCLSRYERALIFTLRAHGDQKRKYTGENYIVHPIAVAGMLKDAGLDEDVQIAGLLHDVIEDTSIVYGDIRMEFGAHVADLVLAVTNVSKPSDGNRETRKAIDRNHLANASAEAQSLKVCDLLSNTNSIVEHDPKFARVYLPEKRALLEVLTRAHPDLLARAYAVLEAGERKIVELTKADAPL